MGVFKISSSSYLTLNVPSDANVDRFLGHWNVNEIVFDSQGHFVGKIRQERKVFKDEVETIPNNVLVVVQDCIPEFDLNSHPLQKFMGRFEFKLIKDKERRLYMGPDVVGHAFSVADRVLIGRGYWPRLNCHFESWSINIDPLRQLTGGVFFHGMEVLAVIYGMAYDHNSHIPAQSFCTPELNWHPTLGSGLIYRSCPKSGLMSEIWVQKSLNPNDGWVETSAKDTKYFSVNNDVGRFSFQNNSCQETGTSKVYGPHLYWKSFGSLGQKTEGLEILDLSTGQSFSIRKEFVFDELEAIEVHFVSKPAQEGGEL